MFGSKFIKNVLTLSSGTFLSQFILFILTPILSRIYNPESFGILALYFSIVGIFWGVSSGKYELAIVLPKDDSTAKNLLTLSIICNILFFIVSSIIIFLFKTVLGFNFNIIFVFIPFGIFIESMISTINQYNIRHEKYKYISIVKIFRSVVVSLLQIAFYFFGIKTLGLIWGLIIGAFLSLALLIIPYYNVLFNLFKSFSKDSLFITAKEYIDFPKFQLTSSLINAISQNSILLLLSFFYGTVLLGYYSLAHRVLKVPITLVADSIKQIFYKEAANLLNKNESIYKIYKNTTWILILISVPIIIIVWNFLPYLFVFIFGDKWFLTGQYAQILIFWLLFIFINPPSVASILLLGLQRQYMYYEALLLIFRVISICIGYYFYSNMLITLKLVTLVGVLFNLILITYVYLKVKLHAK